MKKIIPILMTDFYKIVHQQSYVPNLDYLFSYWTPRKSRVQGVDKVVNFGLQYVIKDKLIDYFNENFFERDWQEIEAEYKRIIEQTMTGIDILSPLEKMKALHDLGYLPIRISAIEEGERVDIGVPMFEITNTIKGYGWLVNYLETYISCNVWLPMTSATTGYRYREIANKYYGETVDAENKEKFAIGDFSMRGMTSFETAMVSSAGHLLSFLPTATIPSILWVEEFYNGKLGKSEKIGTGTASMEHSVMSSYGKEGEFDAYKKLITEIFPSGNLSIVSDTYDYWRVLTEYLPKLRDDIISRPGTILIRGDSGDPVDIIAGKEPCDQRRMSHPENKGTVELLWDIFGGYVNEKGYKVLDPHIRAIYGDSITPERAEKIYARLKAKGFSAENVILGAGSYSYQYVTRDTYGFALKATHAVIDGEERQIFKDPITDNKESGHFKKSHKGLVYVGKTDQGFYYKDELTLKDFEKPEYQDNQLKPVFEDGKLLVEFDFSAVRSRLHQGNF